MAEILQRANQLVASPAPEVPYRIPGVLPKGAIMMLGGETKIGKSFLALDLAHGIASGVEVWGWRRAEPCPVLYIEIELGWFGVQKRLKARYPDAAAVPPGFWISSRDPDVKLDTPAGLDRIRSYLDKTEARVLILDPVARLMLGLDFDGSQVGRALSNIDRLLGERPELSVILIHHFVKPRENLGTDSFYRFRGGRWMDAADVLCVVERKSRNGEPFLWRVHWTTRHDVEPDQEWFKADERGVVTPAEPPATKKGLGAPVSL